MSNPNGNPGNKGGGRQSAYQEKANAELLYAIFFGELDKDEVQARLRSGKYSLKDVFISKAYAGNERILIEIFKKIFPDQKILRGDGENPIQLQAIPGTDIEAIIRQRIAELIAGTETSGDRIESQHGFMLPDGVHSVSEERGTEGIGNSPQTSGAVSQEAQSEAGRENREEDHRDTAVASGASEDNGGHNRMVDSERSGRPQYAGIPFKRETGQ